MLDNRKKWCIMNIELYLWYAFMSESVEKSQDEKKEWEPIICPVCGLKTAVRTKKKVIYTIDNPDNKVWCRHCQRYAKFNLE